MKVLLTGASGVMGIATLRALQKTDVSVRAFCLNHRRDIKKVLKNGKGVEIFIGDLSSYQDVYNALDGIDWVLHLGAIIPPQADKNPKRTFEVNFGSTKHFIDAINARGMQNVCKMVYVSTVAVYGDRLPPIHWCRVGDPVKSSYFDYYAQSKIASERLLIESNLKYWVILRQTGIVSPSMLKQRSPLIFHQPLHNVLEYLSDRDSGRLLKSILTKDEPRLWGAYFQPRLWQKHAFAKH